jgi:uncharacterized protein
VRSKFWLIPLLLFACAAYLSLVYMPRAALHVPRYPITLSPADVGLDYESVTFQSAQDNIALAAWWIPAPQPRANLVFVHGHGSNRHSNYFRSLDFYRAMVDAQVSVLALDLRNHGESGTDERGLQWGKAEAADVIAGINWLRQKSPDLPLLAAGKSMGGATVINAAAQGARVDALILVDPLLDTQSTFANGGWVETGLPSIFFAPAAAAAVTFYGLPDGDDSALALASDLKLPMLIIQDPEDPVTLALYARQLASSNPGVTLWEAPAIDGADRAEIAWKGRWGSHVAAFHLYPEETLEQINNFIARIEQAQAEKL